MPSLPCRTLPTAILSAVCLAVAVANAESPARGNSPGVELRFEPLSSGAALNQLALTPDGRRLCAGSAAGEIAVWDVQSGRRIETIPAAAGDERQPISTLHVDADSNLYALARNAFLHRDPMQRLTRTRIAANGPVASAISPRGTRLALCGPEPPIRLFDTASYNVQELDPALSADQLAFSPDGAHLAGARLWRICFWNAATGEELWKRRLEGTVRGFTFSRDGQRIYADVDYEGIMILDAATGTVERTLPRPGVPEIDESARRAVALSPDASVLAESGPNGSIIVWEIFTGRRVLSLTGHGDLVTGLAFLPDGHRLVSVGRDGAACLWDLHSDSLGSAEYAQPELSPGQLQQLWHQLGEENDQQAYLAFLALRHHPKQAVQVIESSPGVEGLVERLIRRLDHDDSAVRSAAYQRLKGLSIAAEPLLRQHLDSRMSAEVASRIRRLLGRLRGRRGERERYETAHRHRLLRSVHLLKWINSPAARTLLDQLATRTDDRALLAEIESVRRTLTENSRP